MNLIRVNPLRDFDRVFDRFWSDFPLAAHQGSQTTAERTWAPSVDIEETENALVFTMDVPGLEKSDINISVENNQLTITGERKPGENSGETLLSERWTGKIFRSFRLTATVDAENISANLKNGVLTLVVPKREEARPRQIPVSVQ